MKKVFLMLAAVAAMTFVSCGDKKGNDANNDAAADSIVAAAQEGDVQDPEQLGADLSKALEANDSEGLKGKIDAAKEWAKNLLAEGKGEQAKSILEKIQSFLSENADKVTSVIGDNQYVQGALDFVKGLNADEAIQKLGGIVGVEDVANTAKDAANAVTEKAEEGVNKVKEAVAEPVEKAKEKADEVKQDLADKGNEAIEAAKNEVNKVADKANDAVNQGINNVRNLVK